MAILFDTHLHTRRHSGCSQIDEAKLIDRAVRAGLQGLIITEHHYQWPEEDLAALAKASGHPGFVLLAGFEYSAVQGDILVYGLEAAASEALDPYEDAFEAVSFFHARGALCVAAHPTRAGLSYDTDIVDMGFDALEVRSVNLKLHEQRLAEQLAGAVDLPGLTSSDAHRLEDVGAYALAFDEPIRSTADFAAAVRGRRCRPAA